MSSAETPRADDLSDAMRWRLQQHLTAWFRSVSRDLPWRRVRDPYAIWVSEVMLQQTQVTTVIPYYERFLERFPTVRDLATAPLEEVLSLWRGLGYYARARNLHRGAIYVIEHHDGRIPDSLEAIRQVPGIGRYTAGAILSIAYGQAVPLLDGNVARVLSRVFGRYEDPKGTEGQKVLWSLAGWLVEGSEPADFNQALMELGALVCTPASPACAACPIRTECFAATLPDPTVLPVKSAVKARPEVTALGLVIERPDGALLMGLRPAEGLLGGLWELPTGVMLEGESIDAAARRVGLARLGRAVAPAGEPVEVEHTFTHLQLYLHVVAGRVEGEPVLELAGAGGAKGGEGRGRKRGVDQIEVPYQLARWVDPDGLKTLPMGKATLKALAALQAAGPRQMALFGGGRRKRGG